MAHKYIKNMEIQSGYEGVVYSGERLVDGLPVALKVQKSENCEMCKTCCGGEVPQEVCMLKKARGVPGVITLHDSYKSSKNQWTLVLERPVPCCDLFDVIDSCERIDEQAAKNLFRQIYHTVFELSERNIAHGDLKVENVLVNMATYETRIIDFGMASHFTEDEITHFKGTRVFATPEYLERKSYKWEDHEVWTLGHLLYNILHGYDAFDGQSEIIHGQLKTSAKLSKEVTDLLHGCLKKDPEKRMKLKDIGEHEWLL